jgi:hypothetical protein
LLFSLPPLKSACSLPPSKYKSKIADGRQQAWNAWSAAPYRLHGSEGEKTLAVNKITWQKAGRVTEPGRYMFTFGWLTVTAEDLAVWEQFPSASFTLVQTATAAEGGEEFRLGAFQLQKNPPLNEN